MDLFHLLRGYRPMSGHEAKISPAVVFALKLRMGRVITALSSIWKGPDPAQLRLTRDRHGNFGQTSTSGVGLTSWEIRTLKKNWFALREQKQIGLACFAALFDKHPDAKGVFGLKNATVEQALDDQRVRSQALTIEDTIEMVIVDLSQDSDGLRWPLVQLGEQHFHFGHNRGFKHDYLITLGVALLDTVAQQPTTGMRRLKRWKILRMWRRFVYFVLTCLLTGYYLAMDPAYTQTSSGHNRRVKASYQDKAELAATAVNANGSSTTAAAGAPGQDVPSSGASPKVSRSEPSSTDPHHPVAAGSSGGGSGPAENRNNVSATKSTSTLLSPPKANPRAKRSSTSNPLTGGHTAMAAGANNEPVPILEPKNSAVGTMMLNMLNVPVKI